MNYNIECTKKLEKEWQESLPKYSDKDLLEIFPEAEPYLKDRVKELKKKSKIISNVILEKLTKIYSLDIKDEFSIWFFEEALKTFLGEDLDNLEKEIKRLSLLINPKKEKEGRITEGIIERARNYPFENLIQFNRAGFTECFAHQEKTPSLHLYKKENRIYCFGCNRGWDTIQFIRETKGLSFIEAVKLLS